VTGATLDCGALIAFERGSPRMLALVERATDRGLRLAVPAGVVAQTWPRGRSACCAARPAPPT
jgi:hypothetical protein